MDAVFDWASVTGALAAEVARRGHVVGEAPVARLVVNGEMLPADAEVVVHLVDGSEASGEVVTWVVLDEPPPADPDRLFAAAAAAGVAILPEGGCRGIAGFSCFTWQQEGACPHVDERRWLRRPPEGPTEVTSPPEDYEDDPSPGELIQRAVDAYGLPGDSS